MSSLGMKWSGNEDTLSQLLHMVAYVQSELGVVFFRMTTRMHCWVGPALAQCGVHHHHQHKTQHEAACGKSFMAFTV